MSERDELLDAGPPFRQLREQAGLSQAAVAEAVGTTQQTVDRIEKGEVTHSRYSAAITTFLQAANLETGAHGTTPIQPGVGALAAGSISTRRGKTFGTFGLFRTFGLTAGGELIETEAIEGPSFLKGEMAYALVLHRGQKGPAGDLLYRAGDVLFVDPRHPIRHFDTCVSRPIFEKENGLLDFNGLTICTAFDPAEADRSALSSLFRPGGYVDVTDQEYVLEKIVAVYTR